MTLRVVREMELDKEFDLDVKWEVKWPRISSCCFHHETF